MKIVLLSLIFLTSLGWAGHVGAETQSGVIRNVNCGSHSFGLDVPPMLRVYTTEGTRFETPAGNSCRDLKEGDRVEVELKPQKPGTAIASRVKVVGNLAPVKDLVSKEVEIKLNQSFLMGVNQSAALKDGGKLLLRLRSTEFINTLCKDGGYDCSGEGEVGMRFKVSAGGDDNEIVLLSKNARKPATPVTAELLGYVIQLMEAGEDVVILVVRKA